MPFTAYYLSPAGELRSKLTEEEIGAAVKSGEGLLWVDISATTAEDAKLLENTFGLHPLAVEDCLSAKIHPPKVDDFGDYLFIVVHGVNYTVESEVVQTAELAIFLGTNFVISNHTFPLYCIEATERSIESNSRVMKQGADFLSHTIIDALVDNIMPAIDKMTEIAEDIEEQIVRNPQPPILEAILRLKRSAIHLHRVMAPQRDVLNRISRGDFSVVREEAKIFYRDIYDHIVRIEDLNQTVRDMTDNALSTYLSSVANRQNEVMKVLSIVAAIFLPLTLVVGIYGMNFENMPELKLHWGYYAVLGFIGAVIIGMTLFFWFRGWFNFGRRRILRVRSFIIDREKLRGYRGHSKKEHSPRS
jgi:magnesium transporter